MPRVAIIGAGLAGSLLAIYLAKREMEVDVYEARGDMRLEDMVAGRSINLALSDRGIAALREIGMDEYMLAEAVPMYGRMIHSSTGETKLLPYSGRSGEYINSISRGGLNIALINEAERCAGAKFHFQKRCVGFNCDTGEARFADVLIAAADTVIAADGAGSTIRQAMEKQVEGFASSTVFLEHGYKELHIPPAADGGFALEKNALHIWPRHQFMMIALPNFDGSFTCTLFLARKSAAAAFDKLDDEASVTEFFEREFPDVIPLMPTLVEDFFANPTGELGTVKCWPWNVGGKGLLLGDAAHAMVPFYGQGMNCGFEDVRMLASLVNEHGADWQRVYNEYCSLRKSNTDAIQDMAVENFYEMRDRVADPVFQRKRALETRLEQTYADYFSKYSMVTFREDMPYSIAKEKGNAQDRLLMELCRAVSDASQLDSEAVMARVRGL
ncbi:MAG TPA: NAD(P)/FAD-dependent oxidoreductase [Pyrinomonadaceae bacterium]|jgi:kynurenine 3-monooxygenase|nr:NAD(P)/FAD-dependent oxidoreductase [Pyrinomonadaceae bacterium]